MSTGTFDFPAGCACAMLQHLGRGDVVKVRQDICKLLAVLGPMLKMVENIYQELVQGEREGFQPRSSTKGHKMANTCHVEHVGLFLPHTPLDGIPSPRHDARAVRSISNDICPGNPLPLKHSIQRIEECLSCGAGDVAHRHFQESNDGPASFHVPIANHDSKMFYCPLGRRPRGSTGD